MKERTRSSWILLNAVGYQAVWLACALGAARGALGMALLALPVFAAITLTYGGSTRADLRYVSLVLPVGWALDSFLLASGVLSYATPWPLDSIAPAWIVAIWAAFALTLNHSLSFLTGRPGMSAVLGAVGGPLAYLAAARLGAVRFELPLPWALLALSAAWAAVLPLIVSLNRHVLARRPLPA